MRFSHLFGHTLKQAPATASNQAEKLLIRSGMMRHLTDNRRVYLPPHDAICQNLVELMVKGYEPFSPSQIQGPVTRAVLSEIGKNEIENYKEIPRFLYSANLNSSEELNLTGVFFTASSHQNPFQEARGSIEMILSDFNIPGIWRHDNDGNFIFLTTHEEGHEDGFKLSDNVFDLASTADFVREDMLEVSQDPLEMVETPDCKTISDLANFLGVHEKKTLKAVFYSYLEDDAEIPVLIMIRGDLDVNIKKVEAYIGRELFPSTEESILKAGAVPGYASPIDLNIAEDFTGEGLIVLGDKSIETSSNLVTGANKAGYHFINANWPRDFTLTEIADFAQAEPGFLSENTDHKLEACKLDVLGTFTQPGEIDGKYTDRDGKHQPLFSFSVCLNLTRIIENVILNNHDKYGIIWPDKLSPFQLHITSLLKDPALIIEAESLYKDLINKGYRVLYDRRKASPGVKFSDADLLGAPIRLTISERSLDAGGYEMKRRDERERNIISKDDLGRILKALL